MGKHREFEITESLEVLQDYKQKVSTYKSAQRLDCLILIKSEKYSRLVDISGHLSINFRTMQTWIKEYKEFGLEFFMRDFTRKRFSKIITPKLHQLLEERLKSEENPFSGYIEVQEWLYQEHGIKIEYQWLWKYMREKFNSRLKVPRKTNINKKPEDEKAFLKTTRDIQVN